MASRLRPKVQAAKGRGHPASWPFQRPLSLVSYLTSFGHGLCHNPDQQVRDRQRAGRCCQVAKEMTRNGQQQLECLEENSRNPKAFARFAGRQSRCLAHRQ
jgi:hypothetical protein